MGNGPGQQARTDSTHQRERKRSRPQPSTTLSSTRCSTRRGLPRRNLQPPVQQLQLDHLRPQCLDLLPLVPRQPCQELIEGSDSWDLNQEPAAFVSQCDPFYTL